MLGRYKDRIKYAQILGVYWFINCLNIGFSSVFLLAKGFTSTEIGGIVTLGNSISVLFQPLLARFADRHRRLPQRYMIAGITLVCIFLTALLAGDFMDQWKTAVCYVGVVALLQMIQPLCNAMGFEAADCGIDVDFGVGRGCGSVTYAVGAYLSGIVVERFGVRILILFTLLGFILLEWAVLAFRYRQVDESRSADDMAKKSEFPDEKGFFKRYYGIAWWIAGCSFNMFGHSIVANYGYQIVLAKGGGSREMGMVTAIAAISELPMMFWLFKKLQKKLTGEMLVNISSAAVTVRCVLSLLVPDIRGLYLIQPVQMFGYALFTLAGVHYMEQYVKESDRVKGQAGFTMALTLGGVLASLTGGMLFDMFGIGWMLLTASAAAGIGSVMIAFSLFRMRLHSQGAGKEREWCRESSQNK